MKCRHIHHHHSEEDLYVYIKKKLILIIKNIQKMAIISIDIEDNQADLDTLKGQIATSVTALTNAIEAGNAALASLQAFQISFTASVVPPAPPVAG